MPRPRLITFYILSLISGLLLTAPAAAQVVLVHSFSGPPTDGAVVSGTLVGSGTPFCGMTGAGGVQDSGTVFKINADGTGFGLLHSFAGGLNDGTGPAGSLILSGPSLYGMTGSGGSVGGGGTVFRVNVDGTAFSLLHRFQGGAADGLGPLGTPALSGATLYGMTPQGGTANVGTVFKMNTDGTGFGVLHSFSSNPADGQTPGYSTLAVSGSTLYGMTAGGGTAGTGTVFKVNTDGTGFALLHSFVPATGDGWSPYASPVLVGSTLYGMTRQGGGAAGTIFKISTDGTGYQILHSFTGVAGGGDGANPVVDLLLVGSTLYGTTPTGGTADLGTLFKINTDGSGYQVLYSFSGGASDPANPAGLTIVGSTLYGMSGRGGTSNFGTIWSYPIAVPEPSALLLAGVGSLAALARLRRDRRAAASEKGS